MVARVKPNTKVHTKDKAMVRVGGRPTKYQPEYNEQVARLCKLGITDRDIAIFFNVAQETIALWKHKHPEFFVAMLQGKQKADQNVAERLYDNTQGFYYDEEVLVKKWRKKYDKSGNVVEAYEVIEKVMVQKYQPPNVTAQIFFLKNRRKDVWRDGYDVSVEEKNAKPEAGFTGIEEIQAEMKKRGIVVLEGAYTEVKK